jgi:predicted glycosyltransferase
VYTGFVTPRPSGDGGEKVRIRLGLEKEESLIVASAGGGRVGEDLLTAVVEAHALLAGKRHLRLCVFTGPYMTEAAFLSLSDRAASLPGVELTRFTPEFLSYLAAADISISMAGYNTCMNIMAAGVPALVFPFAQNREQKIRAEKLASLGGFTLLAQEDLEPSRLAFLMDEVLRMGKKPVALSVNLNGAEESARWIEVWFEGASS